MELSDINEKSELVTKFVEYLAKQTRQAIPIVESQPTDRVGGVSARPIHIALEQGQIVKLFIRVVDDHADLFKITINGRNIPINGDFSLDYLPSFRASVKMIADVILKGQARFDKKRGKQSTKKAPSTTGRQAPKNKTQQLKELQSTLSELDNQIEQKTQIKANLEQQLANIGA